MSQNASFTSVCLWFEPSKKITVSPVVPTFLSCLDHVNPIVGFGVDEHNNHPRLSPLESMENLRLKPYDVWIDVQDRETNATCRQGDIHAMSRRSSPRSWETQTIWDGRLSTQPTTRTNRLQPGTTTENRIIRLCDTDLSKLPRFQRQSSSFARHLLFVVLRACCLSQRHWQDPNRSKSVVVLATSGQTPDCYSTVFRAS